MLLAEDTEHLSKFMKISSYTNMKNKKQNHNDMFGVIRFKKTFFHSSPLYDCNLKRCHFLLPLHFVNLKILQHIKRYSVLEGKVIWKWFE